jgi:hypothetical protein
MRAGLFFFAAKGFSVELFPPYLKIIQQFRGQNSSNVIITMLTASYMDSNDVIIHEDICTTLSRKGANRICDGEDFRFYENYSILSGLSILMELKDITELVQRDKVITAAVWKSINLYLSLFVVLNQTFLTS